MAGHQIPSGSQGLRASGIDLARQGFFENFNTSGTQVRLTYSTKFAAGNGQEEFVWVKNGDGFTLLGYHINSMELITK